MRIKRYIEYIKEDNNFNPSASWGLSALDSINSKGSIEPKDPNLSFDPYDKNKSDIKNGFDRISSIMKDVFNTTSFNFGQHFEENIEDLTIVKLYKNNNNSLDMYIKFIFMDELFYASFKNWLSTNNNYSFHSMITELPTFKYNKENLNKLIGILLRVLTEWFSPIEGDTYKVLKDVKTYTQLGSIFTLPQGAEIIVDTVLSQEMNPSIYIEYNGSIYSITGLDYYYFNYWFDNKEKKTFYL